MIFVEPNEYVAETGKTFKRIIDDLIMGNNMYLYDFIDGTPDVIDNYVEIDDPDYVEETDE